MSNKEAAEYISEHIYKQLNSPEAVRTRKLMALAAKNPVIKVAWDKELPPSQKPGRK